MLDFAIAAALKARGFASAHAKKVSLKARPGSLEVWFGAESP